MAKRNYKKPEPLLLAIDTLKMKDWLMIWSIRNTNIGYANVVALAMTDDKPAEECLAMAFRVPDELLPEFLKINKMEGSFYAKETPGGLAELDAAHAKYIEKVFHQKQ